MSTVRRQAESFCILLFHVNKANQLHTTGTPFSFSAAMKNIDFDVYAIQHHSKTLEGPEI